MSSERPTSQKRCDANKKNSDKSTGPRTDAGKKNSSRNALKHGLTAKHVVLPNEDPAAYEGQMNQWTDYYRPQDPAQLAAIERAVVSKWRLDRCVRVETERLSKKVRHAETQYDFAMTTEAEEVGRRLIYDPLNRCQNANIYDPVVAARIEQRKQDNPAVLANQLQTTAQGVDWMLDQWVTLGEMLHQHGYWHYPEKFRAIWLLGKRPEDFLEDKLLQRIYLAANVAHPDTDDTDPDAFDLLDECIQAKLGIEGKPMYFVQVNEIRRFRPGDKQTAQAILWDILTKEMTRLRELKANHLDPIDDADRAAARERAMFDDSKEAVLLRRYESACERELHRSIADLGKLRKDAANAPATEFEETPEGDDPRNEPIAETFENEDLASSPTEPERFESGAEGSDAVVDRPATPFVALSGSEPTPAAAL